MPRFCYCLAFVIAAMLLGGCGHPLSSYDRGRDMLTSGHERIRKGDGQVSVRSYGAAADTYSKASSDLQAAVDHFQQAEAQIIEEIRQRELQRQLQGPDTVPTSSTTITIAQRPITVSTIYADTLRSYREARALAVVLQAMATAREAEASYRRGAVRTYAGDHHWQQQQFNSALSNYRTARDDLLRARQVFDQAIAFMDQQMTDSTLLSEAAPQESWRSLKLLQPVISRRQSQIDAWLQALDRRIGSSARIVQAYRQRQPGNLPGVKPPFLEPLPSEVRISVQHPPVPANRPGKAR